MRLSLLLSVAVLLISCTATCTGSEVIDRLLQIWAAQRSEITSAHFRLRTFRQPSEGSFGVDEVKDVLERFDLVENAEQALAMISDALKLGIDPSESGWVLRELKCEGARIREERYHNGDHLTTTVDDGQSVLRLNATHEQVDVSSVQLHSFMRISHLRYVPSANLSDEVVALGALPDGRQLLKVGRRELVADPETGFIDSLQLGAPSGQLVETWQLGPTLHPGDILFPSVVVSATFHGGKLAIFTAIVIDEATFNVPIEPGTFSLASASPLRVLDYRKDSQAPVFHSVAPNSDVAEAIDKQSGTPVPAARHDIPGERNLFAIVALNIAAVILVAVVVALCWKKLRSR